MNTLGSGERKGDGGAATSALALRAATVAERVAYVARLVAIADLYEAAREQAEADAGFDVLAPVGSRRAAGVPSAEGARDPRATARPGGFEPWVDAVIAEVGAIAEISHQAAARLIQVALAMHRRAPTVLARAADGCVSRAQIVSLVEETDLLLDAAMPAVDAELAAAIEERVGRDCAWSMIAWLRHIRRSIARHDPEGATADPIAARRAAVSVSVRLGGPGSLASIFACLPRTVAQLFSKQLAEVAGSVCANDPRTRDQRRADAFAAIISGFATLGCWCPDVDCPHAERRLTDPALASRLSLDIVVIASEQAMREDATEPVEFGDEGTMSAATFRRMRRDYPTREHPVGTPPAEAGSPAARDSAAAGDADDAPRSGAGDPASPATAPASPAADSVRVQWTDREAKTDRSGWRVGKSGNGYRPSMDLKRAIWARDLGCTFPGCNAPAARCDIDHTREYNHDFPEAGGLTEYSNLKLLCRRHHLILTHGGWVSAQAEDGTVTFSSPWGSEFHTRGDGPLWYPGLSRIVWIPPTAPAPGTAPPTEDPPKRRVGDLLERKYRDRDRKRAEMNTIRAANCAAKQKRATVRTRVDEDPPPF